MALQRIATTSLSALRALGPTSDRDWHRVVTWLEGRRAFGASFARLFAEPVYSRGSEQVDWYWDPSIVGTALRQLSSLPEPERQRVLDLVRSQLAAVRAESQRLHAHGDNLAGPLLLASSVPEPLAERVWWQASPALTDGGQAVVVDWGFAAEAPSVLGGDIVGVRPRIVEVAVQRRDLGSGVAATERLPQRGVFRWVTATLLWVLFIGVVSAVAVLLLQGCGINGARWGLADVPWLSYCTPLEARPAPIPDRTWELAAELKQLELAIARSDSTCLAELTPPIPLAASPPALPQPVPDPVQRSAPPDDRLRLPANPSTDLSFLTGCWQSDPFKHAPERTQPGISTYCFDSSGLGTLVFKRAGSSYECRLPVRARTEGQALFLDDVDGTCNDGTEWWADHLVCKPDRSGVAVCSGSSRTARWSVNLHKK